MDHILANKAVFKSATDTAGDVGLMGGLGMAMAGRRSTQGGRARAGRGWVRHQDRLRRHHSRGRYPGLG